MWTSSSCQNFNLPSLHPPKPLFISIFIIYQFLTLYVIVIILSSDSLYLKIDYVVVMKQVVVKVNKTCWRTFFLYNTYKIYWGIINTIHLWNLTIHTAPWTFIDVLKLWITNMVLRECLKKFPSLSIKIEEFPATLLGE